MKKWTTSLRRLIFLAATAAKGILKTVTGNPIHILDALAKPAQALSVKLEPIQDLNGYDNPWPAGGGKNKFDSSLMADAGTGAKFITLNLKPNTAYTMSSDDPCKDNGTITDLFFCNMDESVSSGTNGVKLNKSVTRTSDANGQLRVGYRCYEAWITPEQLIAYHSQVEEGSTATAWTPYSNICPISGHSDVDVTRTGKNMWGKDRADAQKGYYFLNGEFHADNNYRCLSFPCKEGDKFTKSGTGWGGIVTFWDGSSFVSGANNTSVTVPSGANIAKFACLYSSADAQLELGSTASDYEFYAGNSYTISLGTTVYGGTLDVLTGVLTVTMAKLKASDFSSWAGVIALTDGTGNYAYKANAFGGDNESDLSVMSDSRERKAGGASWEGMTYGEFIATKYLVVTVPLSVTTSAEAVTYFSNNDVEFVYELATPITIQLTPTQVELLLGENNLFSDGEMTLVYLADGNASEIEALNILLGGRYVNNHTEDEPSDREALDIVLGGKK